MKYLGQFGIIIAISLVGEVLKFLIPLPVPASIYGLVLMLAALKTGAVPLSSVKETSMFLIDIMPLMFIPAAVGLLTSWEQLAPAVLPVLVITLVSTVVVMAASGCSTQFIIRRGRKRKEGSCHE